MINRIKIGLYAGFLVLLISACKDNQTRLNLTQVKQLQHSRDSIEKVYNSIEFTKFHEIEKKIIQNVSYVSKHMELFDVHDTLFANYYGSYAATGKAISRLFRKRMNGIEPSLEYSERQLKNLKHDIGTGVIGSQDTIQIYLRSEKRVLDGLITDISDIHELFDQELIAYKKTNVKVQQLLDETMKKQADK